MKQTIVAAVAVVVLLAFPSFAGFAGKDLFIPIAGRVEGQGGSQFYTTVWITNDNLTPATVTIDFLMNGFSNVSPLSSAVVLLAGETKTYENIIETMFNRRAVLGALRFRSATDILVTSRSFNQFPGETLAATQGLFFSAAPAELSLRCCAEKTTLQGVNQGGLNNFRYNFFMVETSGKRTGFRVQIKDAAGVVQADFTRYLQPYEYWFRAVSDHLSIIENGTIEATVVEGEGTAMIGGALTANTSQDSSGFEMKFPTRTVVP